MSVLAGAINLNRELRTDIQQRLDEVEAAIRHSWGEGGNVLLGAGVVAASRDFGAFEQPAAWQDTAQFAALTGHPLISSNRTDDLKQLLDADDLHLTLQQSDGAFCFLHYLHQEQKLTLATDALGLRPFYYTIVDEILYFSSQLKWLHRLGVANKADPQGLIEFSTLGFFLLDNTPYDNVKCARPAEVLVIEKGRLSRSRWLDWQSIATQTLAEEEALNLLTERFQTVCAKYAADDTHSLTLLSGGLDSRVINQELSRKGLSVLALNFSVQETQDLACAKAFAQEQRIPLEVVQVADTQAITVEQRLGTYRRSGKNEALDAISRPRLCWSGNGGSVGIGWVYYSEAIYRAAKNEDVERLVDLYIEQQSAYVSKRMIKNANELQQALKRNLVKSFDECGDLPLEKAFQLFLLFNDQHHHLAVPYEDIDEYQMDFCVPLLSWKVLACVLSQPVEKVRGHQFYMKWLQRSYPEVLNTPWQAYPGHVPCHLPMQGQDQWQMAANKRLARGQVVKAWREAFGARAEQPIKMGAFTLSCSLHLLGLWNAGSHIGLVDRMTRW
uniref:7-cyano-7-deazaguanine synthase n=1 Tax=Thaumasiovibrio occultus TaxID=1891184 RepID=UPI000B353393|nr:7-cyano-7-deazaguanine synthase [Thaumasiovibrio occultus]